jgi:uncharacterized protein YcfL
MNKLKKTVWCGAVLAVCLAGVTGCVRKTSGTEIVGVMVESPEGSSELSRAVLINNAKLGRTIQVVNVRHEYAGDVLKAAVTVTSRYAGTLDIKYKFAWFNANGVEVHTDTDAWTPVILNGYETRTIQGVAPSADVKGFKINIRD